MTTYLTGIVRDGPKKGKTLTSGQRRIAQPGGFYVYRAPKGPAPSEWIWIAEKKDGTK